MMNSEFSKKSGIDWQLWKPVDLDPLIVKLYERSFYDFIQAAFPIVEPSVPFQNNWHIEGICRHLEAVTDGRIKKLLINVPPGTMKSLLVGVFWPAWVWITRPECRWMFGGYSQDLSSRDSAQCRTLIESPWYKSLWGHRVKVRSDQNQKTRFENTAGGWRLATSVGGRGTGEHPDIVVFDDPITAMQSESPLLRQDVNLWWTGTMTTRGVGRDVRRVGVMQRLHEDDLSGHILRHEEGWTHICLPMRYEPERMQPTPLGWTDERAPGGKHEGQPLLWPEMFPEEKVKEMERTLGPYATAGQLQQRPAPASGGIFDRAYFRYFRDSATSQQFTWEEPDGSCRAVYYTECTWLQTVDTALKTGELNAYTVVLTLCLTPAPVRVLVVAVFRRRVPVPNQLETIVAQRTRFPLVSYQGVEEAASGIGLLQAARLRNLPLYALKALGSKETRCLAIAAQYASSMVYHKAADQAPWLTEFEHELLAFPRGRFSDQVDCLAHAGMVINQMLNRRQGQTGSGIIYPGSPVNTELKKRLEGKSYPQQMLEIYRDRDSHCLPPATPQYGSYRDEIIARMLRDEDDDLPTWGR